MPTLLQINVDTALYSCGKICEDISIVAQKQGWETYVAYGREQKAGVNKEVKVGSMINVYEHYFEHRFFDNEGLASRWPTRKLIKEISRIKPDIVQLHDIHDHWLNYKILFEYLKKQNIQVVWTLHDCWAFTGGCFYYDQENCDKWQVKCEDCPQKRSYLIAQTKKQFELRKRLFEDMDNLTLVPVSEWLANSARQSFLKKRRIITIHNGINLSLFKPTLTKSKEKNSFNILGVAAVWDRRKGLDDFIKIRSLLPSDYHITLVGLKNKQIESLPDGITGIEKTFNVQELVKLYSEADVFLNPTYSDNFPTTNIEALACGTPVITYKTGGSPEAINHKTGIVVEQGDINGLVVAIKKLKEHPLLEVDCRERAERLFNKDECFKSYVNLYNELLSEK